MAELYAVSGETLTGIADAIRSKTGSDDFLTVAAMASAIEGISGGSGIPFASKMSCGSFTPESDDVLGRYFYHNLGAIPKLFIIYTNDLDEDSFNTGKNYYLFLLYVPDGVTGIDALKKTTTLVYNSTGTDSDLYRSYGNDIGVVGDYSFDDRIYLKGRAPYYLKAGAQYNWIALA